MQKCKFSDFNILDDYGVECTTCGKIFYSLSAKPEVLNSMGLMCDKPNKIKVYYARPINLYGTPQDKRDIELIEKLGFEIINPNKEILAERYKKEGMDVFLEAMKDADALAFRSFPDLSISSGVWKEINQAVEDNKMVIELPTLTTKRWLSVEDTRAYLSLLGNR